MERSVRDANCLYILNERPASNSVGAIDVNQSPSATSLRHAAIKGSLTESQARFFNPRPREALYDLNADPEQLNNVIADPRYQSELSHLKQVLYQWRRATGDTSPRHLTPDWYDRETSAPLPEHSRRGEMPGTASNASRIDHPGPF